MTGIEALWAMRDGKKVRKRSWSKKEYIYFDKSGRIVDEDNKPTYIANAVKYYLDDGIWEVYEKRITDKWINPTYYSSGNFSCECPVCHKTTLITKTPEFPDVIYYCMYCGEKNIIEE